jgi:hypothetical protein
VILQKRGLERHQLAKLIDFLDWETSDNDLYATAVATTFNVVRDGMRPVFISEGRECNCLSPFCRLVNLKSEYDDCGALQFEVVIEIPDQAFLTWIPPRDCEPTRERGEPYDIDAEPYLIMLNAIFSGCEEPKDALKRLTPFQVP